MKAKKAVQGALHLLPLALMLALAVAFVWRGGDFTVEGILSYTPANYWLAALFLVGLYALKSLSVVFPILALYLAGGAIFSQWAGLAVNLVGVAVCVSLPYWIGRGAGAGAVERLAAKYPKVNQVAALQQKHTWYFSFLLRVVGFLPCDVVSLYMGASHVPYGPYLLGTVLGMLPGVLLTTLMGSSITDPAAPAFWLSAVCAVVISAASMVLYRVWLKKQPGAAGHSDWKE